MQYLIFDLVDEVKKAVDITNLSIPYILFTGEYEVLPNIYEELNSNGTSLTKYEVYAAKWHNIFFENISDNIILEKVEKKYLSKKELELFKKNMPLRFLFDIITGHWNSSSDKNLEEELKFNLKDNRFLNPINEETWRLTILNFFDEERKRPMKNVQQEQKILLAFIFNKELYNMKPASDYIFYNIIPKKSLNKKLGNNANALCATSNLFLFPKIKDLKDTIFYELLEYNTLDLNESTLLSLGYPERNEIKFYYEDFSNDKYIKFLKGRENYLINKFVETYVE